MRRVLSLALGVIVLAGLTAGAASSSTPDRPESAPLSPLLRAGGAKTMSSAPQFACTWGGMEIICEFGYTHIRWVDRTTEQEFAVSAANHVVYERRTTTAGWSPVGGATAHSGVSARAFATGVLIATRYADDVKWLCNWYGLAAQKWGGWYFCPPNQSG